VTDDDVRGDSDGQPPDAAAADQVTLIKNPDTSGAAAAALPILGAPEPDRPIYDPAVFESNAALVKPAAIPAHIETVIELGEQIKRRLRAPSPFAACAGDLATASHALGGSAGTFGLQRLSFAAYSFEQAIETGAPETPALSASLIAAIDASLPRIQSLASRTAAAVPTSNATKLGTPSLREAIAAVTQDFVVEAADTAELILDAQRLRYQVYCIERGFLISDNGVEHDEFDMHSRHVVLRRRGDGEVVGTTRLVLHDPYAPDDSYPMQRICDVTLLSDLPLATTAEVSRFAISKQMRGASPALIRMALIQGLFQISHEIGLTDWCATMENSLLRLLKSTSIHFHPLGPLVEYHGLRQPCYANIAEIAARIHVERPEIWAFLTDHGHYYGDRPAAAIPRRHRTVVDAWLATVSDAVESVSYPFYPHFETTGSQSNAAPAASAVLDEDAPPQYYKRLNPTRRGHWATSTRPH
jgi:N-acyl-L-homoserine lactone synthetase